MTNWIKNPGKYTILGELFQDSHNFVPIRL